jgi:four helix bundle protein
LGRWLWAVGAELARLLAMLESFQHRGFRFALETLKVYRKLLANPDVPRHLVNQMCRAGTAIGANLEEAKSAYSRRDLAAKYSIALREGRECRYWLRLVAADQPSLDVVTSPLVEECDQLIAMLTSAVRKLREPVQSAGTSAQ